MRLEQGHGCVKNPARCKVKLTHHPSTGLCSIYDMEMTSSASGRLCHVSAVILHCAQRNWREAGENNSIRRQPVQPVGVPLSSVHLAGTKKQKEFKKWLYEYMYGGNVGQAMCWRFIHEHTIKRKAKGQGALYMRQNQVSWVLLKKN